MGMQMPSVLFIPGESKQQRILLLSIISPNVDRFCKFVHHRTEQRTCSEVIIEDPATPQTCCCTTL